MVSEMRSEVVFKGTMWIWGLQRQRRGGLSHKLWRAVRKILLRCVISADVHYTMVGVKKISGVTVLPFFLREEM